MTYPSVFQPKPLKLNKINGKYSTKNHYKISKSAISRKVGFDKWFAELYRRLLNHCYYRFVDAENANQEGSAWQFQDSFRIEQRRGGSIVVDLLKDGKIGGIEFLDLN